MKIKFIFLLFISVLILSCTAEEEILNSKDDLVSSYQKNFENGNYKLSADYNELDELSSFKLNDKITGDLLFKVELNIISSKIVINDYTRNEEIIVNDSRKIKDFSNLNFEELLNQSSNTRRFFGWQCGLTWGTPGGGCFTTCCYYVFWVQTTCDVFTCSNPPGNVEL